MRRLILICILFLASVSFGQNKANTSLRLRQAEVKKPSAKESQFEIELDLLGANYLSDPIDTRNQDNQYLYFQPKLLWKSQNHTLDLRGVVSLTSEGDNHFYFPETWWSYGAFSFGRKKIQWSQLDDQHHLGLWQPLFRWDHARPESMGFTGVFFEKRINSFIQVKAMASPIFLPDQQPDYQIDEGQLVSGNRWVRNPLTSVLFLNSPTEISYYQIQEPDVEDVIFNESYAFKAELGKSTGVWASASWTNKPMNQFHLGIDVNGTYQVSTDTFFPAIYPFVVNHQLLTWEVGYKTSKSNLYLSITQENFDDPNLPENLQQTPLKDSRYTGFGFRHNIAGPLPGKNELQWSYIGRSELGEQDAATHIEGEVSASTERLRFKSWAGFDYLYSSANRYVENIALKIGYRHSSEDKADWFLTDISYSTKNSWTYYAQADVFGSKNAGEKSFISYYTNNDRIQLGMKYAF